MDMKSVNLKKLISRKEESAVLEFLIGVIDDSIAVLDTEGKRIIGKSDIKGDRFPVINDNNIIGYVSGEKSPEAVAALLGYITEKEADKRAIVRETLEMYKEITMLYAINDKIAACLDPESVASLIINEARKIIKADNASLMLLNEQSGVLEIIAASGKRFNPPAELTAGKGIAGHVLSNGRAEIVNDVFSDYRFLKGFNAIQSMMCAPLRINERVIGVINISSESPFHYTAADLKLLMTLASQASAAIEITRLYVNEKRLAEELKTKNMELQSAREMLARENINLSHNLRQKFAPARILGASRKIMAVLDKVEKIADIPVNVLITGETGTGKELIAKAIHYNSSRSNKPFVTVNCSAIPESIFESEMFGIERGVATGVDKRMGKIECANGGTLFLDEIGDMPLLCQPKILRIIESQRLERLGGRESIALNIRIIAATNRDLKKEVEKGNFREDLFYRINVVNLHLPPLRDRKEDIPLLLNYFLEQCARKFCKPVAQFSPDVIELLMQHHWPGNVRELENEVERAVALAVSDTITLQDVSEDIRNLSQRCAIKPHGLTIMESEKMLIQQAINNAKGNKSEAARLLGLSREGLRKKLKRYELE
jgi:transcriptional regulator with GAF, ATPase, and Fis domain